MAGSDYDSLSIDGSGKPIEGMVTSPLGVVVRFYKNWIYVEDAAAWQDGSQFVHPTVMEIVAGQIRYRDVNISAIRGPQDGIYAVVSIGWKSIVTMAGCAVCAWVYPAVPCGHDLNSDDGLYAHYSECGNDPPCPGWVGVSPKCVAFLRELLLDEIRLVSPEQKPKYAHWGMAETLRVKPSKE